MCYNRLTIKNKGVEKMYSVDTNCDLRYYDLIHADNITQKLAKSIQEITEMQQENWRGHNKKHNYN